MWKFFTRKTTSKNLAASFVTWWKKGRLTEAGLHARHVEGVIKLRTQLSERNRSLRILAKNMTYSEFEHHKVELEKTMLPRDVGVNIFDDLTRKLNLTQSFSGTISTKEGKSFDFEDFKKSHPKIYQDLYQKVVADYEKLAGKDFDRNKFRKPIVDNVRQKCEELLKK